ncbi:MAG: response regulator transcription factor [Elusimicrobiales bacterium]
MPRKIITVLIADDQTLFREGVKDLLENEKFIKVAGEASDGLEAVRMAEKTNPDVILMDIKLPKLDGISATRQVREKLPNVNILMLSSFEDEAHVMEAIQAGANGYLSKMLPAAELVNALKTFAFEGMMIPQAMMPRLVKSFQQYGAPGGRASQTLTKTELRVMALLGEGKCNKEIAAGMGCSVKTIKNHLNSSFQKLCVTSRTEAVVKAIEKGLISAESSRIPAEETDDE